MNANLVGNVAMYLQPFHNGKQEQVDEELVYVFKATEELPEVRGGRASLSY